MDSSDLKASDVLPFLSASDDRLRTAANWIVGHHPDWGGALAGFFRERLSAQNLSETDREVLNRQLAQLSRNPAIQQLLGEVAGNPDASKETRLVALRAMAQASLKETPGAWTQTLPRTLGEADDTIVQAAIAAVRALPAAKTNAFDFSPQLLRVGRDLSRATDVRLDALSTMREGLNSIGPDLFDFLRSNLDSTRPPTTRTTAAAVVGRAKLSDDQLLALADGLKTVGPLEISRLINAFSHSNTEAVGLRLVAALNEARGFSGLRTDVLKPIFEKYSATVQEQGKALLVRLNVDLEKQKAHLDEMLASMPAGDIRRGQAVFNSSKTACLTCHAIGYVGGHVGPDLTNIGQARTERDLLESVIYPSASFVRSYEPMIVVTKSGDEYSGVLRRDAPEEVLLATGLNTEMRIARPEIGEMRPGTVSIMPAGLDEQLSRQELADLVTFLKAAKR
jgi:putative heme-binding domain-containing protein